MEKSESPEKTRNKIEALIMLRSEVRRLSTWPFALDDCKQAIK